MRTSHDHTSSFFIDHTLLYSDKNCWPLVTWLEYHTGLQNWKNFFPASNIISEACFLPLPQGPNTCLDNLKRLLSLIPLQLINNSTCWLMSTFLKCWLDLLDFINPFYPLSNWSILAWINCMRILHWSGQKYLFLVRSISSKTTTCNVFKKKREKIPEPSIPISLRLQTAYPNEWNLQSYLSCPEWLVIKSMRKNLRCFILMPLCRCTQNAEPSIFHQPFSSCII